RADEAARCRQRLGLRWALPPLHDPAPSWCARYGKGPVQLTGCWSGRFGVQVRRRCKRGSNDGDRPYGADARRDHVRHKPPAMTPLSYISQFPTSPSEESLMARLNHALWPDTRPTGTAMLKLSPAAALLFVAACA